MKQGWEIKKLGDVSLKISAGGDKPKLFSETITDICNIPVYANGTVNNGLCGYTNEAIIYDKCITISARGTIGFCCIRTEPFVPIVRLIVVVPKEEVSCEYLCYAVKNLKIINNGGTIPQLTVPMLKEYMIPVPERAEQERIVGELDCLSGIIAAKRAQLRELDTLAQSIFYTMFGDPITNDKGWQTKKLGDVCEIINGFVFKSELFRSDGDLIVRISNIKNGYVDLTDVVCFDKNDYNKVDFDKYIVYPQDIVIALSGATTGKLGINNSGKELYLNQRVAICRENTKNLSKLYLLYFLHAQSLKFLSDAEGVAQPNLSTEQMKRYLIGIPPIDLQKQFAEKIENIERQKELITKSIKETEDLFNSRMSYYFD